MTIDDYVRENQQQFINLLANFVSQKSVCSTTSWMIDYTSILSTLILGYRGCLRNWLRMQTPTFVRVRKS